MLKPPFYLSNITFLIILTGCLLFSGIVSDIYAQSLQQQAKVQYYQDMLHDEGITPQQKEVFFDSIINYYQLVEDLEMEYNYSVEKMKLYYDEGSYLDAYKTGLGILNKMDSINSLSYGDELQRNLVDLIIGKSCSNLGMFDESVAHLFSIIKKSYNRYTIEACSYLGFVFMQMRQMEKSREYNFKAVELLSEADDTIMKKSSCIVYNNLAGYYYTQQQLDSALYYLNRSIDYYDYAENIASKSYIYHNMAIIYQQMGEPEMAETYLRKAIDISENEPYKRARYLQNLAFLLLESNKINLAEQYYFEALKAADESNAKQIKSSVLIELSEVYYKKQQYKRAYDCLQEGVNLRDSIFNTESLEKISLVSQQFENYKISTEKDLIEKELQLSTLSNNQKNIILGILIFLLVAITFAAYIIIRRIHKNSVQNVEKKSKVTQEIIRKEYESSLEEKNRKLASNALFLMKTNEMLTSLNKSIKQLTNTGEDKKQKEIIDEMNSIISSYNSVQSWDEFKLYFEQVHSSFYRNLNKINPDLSKMEQRLCALLVLNMNTKEIAQITNRSVRTIETLIYRIRKDLNIPPEEKTTSFLRTFLEED